MSRPKHLKVGNARKVVAALRSGEYQQGRRALHQGDRFCALGVVCDVSGVGEWVPSTNHMGQDFYRYQVHGVIGDRAGYTMPKGVSDWLGLPATGSFGLAGREIYELNDREEMPFERIADLMEEEWELKPKRRTKMGNIGEPQRHIEFEPFPETAPVEEPAAPAVAPEAVPV